MFDELLEIVKEFFKKLFSSRLFALSVIFTVMFAGLLGKLFQMQILDGSEYQETYMQRTEKTSPHRGPGATSMTETATGWLIMSWLIPSPYRTWGLSQAQLTQPDAVPPGTDTGPPR